MATDSAAIQLTQEEKRVVDLFRALPNPENALLHAMSKKYFRILFILANAIIQDMPPDRWPKDFVMTHYKDLEFLYQNGFALGYAVRAEEKKRK